MTELPSYADLPPAPRGGRSGWGLFGAEDNLGLINLMSPERIAAAARLVRRGQVFCLDMPLGSISPALATFRGPPRHRVLHQPGSAGFDDVYDNFYPQASSQWDSLAHVGYAPDQMYNGVTEAEVLAGARNTIDHWARHGLGVAHTEAVCEYLWNSHAAAIAADNFAVEAFPADYSPAAHPFGFLHHVLIGQFGMALGELWWLADLARDCAADGVYEMFLVSAPLNAPGGIGSPANAVAIK
jgi:hypothetical protein